MKKRLGAVLLALPMTAGGFALYGGVRTNASASAAPAYWSGSDGSGVIAVYDGGDCPIQVKSETLTFRIPDLPLIRMENYRSGVTAEYTLYNPTQQDVSLTLFFPVGFRPDYSDVYEENGVSLPGAEAYSVTTEADGEETSIELSFRHTYYSGRAGQFEITEQLPSDHYAEDGFYGRDLRVTRYSYTVTAPSDGNYYTFCFIYDCNPRKTQVICESGVTGTANGMGVAYAYLSAGETREVTFYAVGEQLTSADIRTKLSVGRGSSSEEASGGSISILTETRQTFAEFVEDFRPSEQTEYGGVSELDWYNAVVAMLLSGESGMLFLSDDLPLLDYLLLWGEYSITIPAGSSVVSRVSAPLFPGIEGGNYTYDYLLSPAWYWGGFGSLTIRIETPYYLSGSSLPFSQKGDALVYSKDSLPMGELSFTLRESKNAVVPYDPYENISPTIVTALILLGVVVVIAVVVAIIAIRIHKRNQEKLAKQQERLRRGRAQEGRIDLPDSPDHGSHNSGNPSA